MVEIHETLPKVNLEEYEKILEDHGHISVYYPQSIIKKTLKEYLIQELKKAAVDQMILRMGPVIEETVNRCFRGE